MTNPCHNCPKRHQACHSGCNRYKLYAIFVRKLNRQREAFRKAHIRIFTPALIARIDDCQRRGNRFWGRKEQ